MPGAGRMAIHLRLAATGSTGTVSMRGFRLKDAAWFQPPNSGTSWISFAKPGCRLRPPMPWNACGMVAHSQLIDDGPHEGGAVYRVTRCLLSMNVPPTT